MENSPRFLFDLTVFIMSSLSILEPSDIGPAESPVSSQSVSESDSEPDTLELEVAHISKCFWHQVGGSGQFPKMKDNSFVITITSFGP